VVDLPAETKKRVIQEVLPPGSTSSTLTVTIGSESSVTKNLQTWGIRGLETTTSRRGRNWVTWQKMQRSSRNTGRPISDRVRYNLSHGDLGTSGFNSTKFYVEMPGYDPVNIDEKQGAYRYQYSGPWVTKDLNVVGQTGTHKLPPTLLDDLMIARGTTAIARTIPTNPVASAAQFLGELREGLPSVPGSHLIGSKSPSSLGDEYLNAEFGIRPIISDFRKFGEAARTSNKVIEQLKRDSGRLIRRRYTFPVERSVETTVVQSAAGGVPAHRQLAPNCYQSVGPMYRTREETYRFWFSGAYTYAYVDGDSAVDRARAAEQRLNRLFGVRINPELLWELAPWSWAVDWFSNTGDVIHNLSALSSDSLVLRWGYIMCHYTCRDTYSAPTTLLRGGGRSPQKQTFVTDVKKRLRATPYGFGLDLGSLTGRQWAILAALGMSRGNRML